jgi:soluble lytic murein transglycosylase
MTHRKQQLVRTLILLSGCRWSETVTAPHPKPVEGVTTSAEPISALAVEAVASPSIRPYLPAEKNQDWADAFVKRDSALLNAFIDEGIPLAGGARIRLAEKELTLGNIKEARGFIEPFAVSGPRLGRSLAAKILAKAGDDKKVIAIYRELLTERRPKWHEDAMSYAKWLMSKPSSARNREAAELYDDVYLDGPKSIQSEAKKQREAALSATSKADRAVFDGRLSLGERALRLASTGRARDALSALGKDATKDNCAGADARGRALESLKRHAEAGDAYLGGRSTCDSDRGIELAFRGARALGRGGQRERATRIYIEIEAMKTSRFADDALFERAKLRIDDGDRDGGLMLLASMVESFPDGDKVGDALSLFATERAALGQWRPIVEVLSRPGVRDTPKSCDERGRIDYWIGRAKLELGDVTGAKVAFVKVLRAMPLGYEGALAAASLATFGGLSMDLFQNDSANPFPAVNHPAIATTLFRELEAIASAGDLELAKAWADELGAYRNGTAPELRVAIALVMARLDASEAQRILRGGCDVHDSAFADALAAIPVRRGSTGDIDPVWRVLYPAPFSTFASAAADREGIPEPLIHAIMREESAFSPRAVSRTGAVGLMQLMPGTAARIGRKIGAPFDVKSLENPEDNIRLGANFLGTLRKRFGGRELLAIPSYNAGPLAIDKWPIERFDVWVERIPYAETRGYTRRVVGSQFAYAVLGDGPTLAAREPISLLQIALRPAPIP